MERTPFHTYYAARMLETLPEEEQLLPVFASSDIQVYPFQVAAAGFTLRSPYQKGAVLCDEAGMGKSHEAMLVIAQRWLEGQRRILLAVPNADLLVQWTELIDRFYTLPYVVLASRAHWDALVSQEAPNAFDQDAILITTYSFLADYETAAREIAWELAVFEEANALSPVYQEDNKQAKALKRIAGSAFKLLLTGTPIEKNIMDLYGLIWFIDETVLPDERAFLTRYLRKPENYPELSRLVSPYCFRTLRAQASHYAKVPRRVLLTYEYAPSPEEQALYDLLYAYVNQPVKLAFPEMDQYELALRLLGLQGSSTAAVLQTIRGVVRRLEDVPGAESELAQWKELQQAAERVKQDAKAVSLLAVLKQGFALMQKRGAGKKAIVFTESVETLKMLDGLLRTQYKTLLYFGGSDYAAIRRFKQDGEILISTDNGAKGFNLEEAAFVIHYDLLYNSLKMEQRIDRCHRLGQENDVLSLAFINQRNMADVRKLELVSKRMLVSDGVFGVSDEVLGGFTSDLDAGFSAAGARLRDRKRVEADYTAALAEHEAENRRTLAAAEDVLFTTFTKELAGRVTLTPRYVKEQSRELNDALWDVAKAFFLRYNEENEAAFAIDDQARTVTATGSERPTLFYYWTGSRNKPYKSLGRYGMGADCKPKNGQITLTSVIGRGILHETACASSGTLTVDGEIEPCEVGLYTVTLSSKSTRREVAVLCGRTEGGRTLTGQECRALLSLPVLSWTEKGERSPNWLKLRGAPHHLDALVPTTELAEQETKKYSPAQVEEIEKWRLQTKAQKAALPRALAELERQLQAVREELETVSGDRLQRLSLQKKATALNRELMKGQEGQFFEEMRLELELEERIKAFTQREKITTSVTRDFILKVAGYEH